MIALAYIVPLLACLLLHFGFRYEGGWESYAWIFGIGEATVGLLHWAFYRSFTSSTEYLGSRVSSIHYEAPWTEKVVHYETRTDSRGRSYTVRRVSYVYHPEKHYFYTTLGTMMAMDAAFFHQIRNLWQVADHADNWYGPHIRGGFRTGYHCNFHDLDVVRHSDLRYWVPITESHRYKNKIRCSNSIFKYEKISKERADELGLLGYPAIIGFDAPAILTKDFSVPRFADDMFRKFNAGVAPGAQMRLYVLLFDHNKGIGTSELQRAYWQGGNKNEFVICIGLDLSGNVHWARAFSWADEQQVEVEMAQWLMKQKTLDWGALYAWMEENLPRWKRKEFKDFNYINVSLPFRHFIWILIISLLENAGLIWFFLDYFK